MKAAKNTSSESAPSSLPLFIKTPHALEPKRHASAGLKKVTSFEFAADTNSVPLVITEVAEAAKHYPIVFTPEAPHMPVAILGIEKKNQFIDADGTWLARSYIPAYIRKYPFVFFQIPNQDDLALCIDEASPHYTDAATTEDAQALFDSDGKPSTLTRQALDFNASYFEHYKLTQTIVEALSEHGLLTAGQSDAELPSGRKLRLSGFQILDTKAFEALQTKDDAIVKLHQAQALGLIYYVLQSQSNWQRLLELNVS